MKTRIKLNKRFYDRAIIDEAIYDWKELCEGRIIDEEFTIELTHQEKIEHLEPEFCNYVLGLMKNKLII